ADVRVWVVGTVFSVERSTTHVAVAVSEGRVRVEHARGGTPVSIGAGESARFELQNAPSEPDVSGDAEVAPAAELPSPPRRPDGKKRSGAPEGLTYRAPSRGHAPAKPEV